MASAAFDRKLLAPYTHRDILQAQRFRACQTLVLVSASLQKSPSVVDVRANEQRVHLRVHVLDGDLETVEAASLRHQHFVADVHGQVLVHDAVARCEEGQQVLDEEAFVVRQICLVREVVHQVSSSVVRTRPPPSCTSATSCSWIGNSTNRFGFSTRNGSGCTSSLNSLRLYSDISNVRWTPPPGGEEPPATCHRESTMREDSVQEESELGAQVVAILE
ncbi:unnamed protein product [Phytophthora fragariaefolia]|uniref:Unnamed protein product n=1 Tax=Phytophthora fragariaefolia TaxID=1490495 RepID=A0A9W6YA80_9STRA|nr:unnamed protein product [Phytophthora fragariaefolia]